MGIDLKVVFPPERLPAWSRVAQLLGEHGVPVQMRMINGELAFPDEAPPDDWRELRVAAAPGMVTLRRDPDGVTLVTWGNADAPLRQFWNALAWALARLTGGQIQTAEGPAGADDFARRAELPPSLQGASRGP